MSSKKVVVFTATGDQGRSVALTLKAAGWDVTGVTRKPSSASAKSLAQQGINMVQGDLNDPASYVPHLEGLYGAFINADFFAMYFTKGLDFALDTEVKQSVAVIDACVKAGVKHIIYSALDEMAEDKAIPHFTTKARVAAYIRSNNIPSTNLYTSTYFSDFLKFRQLPPNLETGGFTLALPMPDSVKIPGYDVGQLGDWALAALDNPEKYLGKDIQVCADRLTPVEMAEIISKVGGKPVNTLHITLEQFYSPEFKKQVTEPIWANFRAYIEGFFLRDEEASRAVNPKQRTFAEWAEQSAELKEALAAE